MTIPDAPPSVRGRRAKHKWRAFVGRIPCLVAVTACGTAGTPPRQAAAERSAGQDVSRYLPLKHDTVFAYDTLSEATGEMGVLVINITRPRPDMAELKVAGKVQRLEIVSDGIRHATGGYLLKAPLVIGARYKGQFGEVRVTALDRAVEGPAGKFSGCAETVEEATTPVAKKVTTTFCPDVGMVLLVAEGMVEGAYATERATLRSFGPRVDLGATAPRAQ
jgi:hypothetical protein